MVDASTGGFEAGFELGGQTREHAILVRSLGVTQLTVAVNKMDMVSECVVLAVRCYWSSMQVQWSQTRFNDIITKLKGFLRQTGFKVHCFLFYSDCDFILSFTSPCFQGD